MHLATRTDRYDIVKLLISRGSPDLTMSNKEGLTAMDICGYTKTGHTIRDTLRVVGAIPGRSRWQERFPISFKTPPSPKPYKTVNFDPSVQSTIKILPIVTTLVATVTFAAAFTMPGGYKNDGPHESLPAFMRNTALQAFVLSDIFAFCSSMVATMLLVYVNALSGDAFLIDYALHMCYRISGVAILSTITALVTAVYVLTSKESLWLAVTSLLMGSAVPLLLFFCYKKYLKVRKRKLVDEEVGYSFLVV
ncbi:hypothetical protein MRB53_021227 [Persea americana]|uniref:Uncharacterized protein n=1 Tax=Persea americana TaxID=3435 RepID=A0ACC2L3T3_PERAE|nr:hypothetical protein MRB53_021227 [Persea americana]